MATGSQSRLSSARGFIPEIQGLRTIALLLVATFHIWFDRVSGGVDVFLLISAYLLTRSLTDRAEHGAPTNPLTFTIRKFARLLPAAVATILLTLAAVLLVLPQNVWQGHTQDALASALYIENLHLQATSVDYFAANDAFTSPYQHFWSLSIQGQVFAAWALLHLLGELTTRATGWRLRPTLITLFTLIFTASLTWSIILTTTNQTFAYFDTLARLWEFAAGSLFALIQPRLHLGPRTRATAVLLGLTGVITCGILLPVASSFPGYTALWPVISAGLVILGSNSTQPPAGIGRALAHPALARIGNYTYALYLTHWPVLVIALFLYGTPTANALQGLTILGISAVTAIAIVHLIEQPTARFITKHRNRTTGRHAAPAPDRLGLRQLGWRAPVAVAVSLALVIGSFVGVRALVTVHEEAAREAMEEATLADLGANADPNERFDAVLPAPQVASKEWVNPGNRCDESVPYTTQYCYQLLPADDSEPERMILNVGSSHTMQFAGAYLEVLERHPTWEMRTHFSPNCDWTAGHRPDADEGCDSMWTTVERLIAESQPDMVVVFGTKWGGADEGDRSIDELPAWIAAQREASPHTEFIVVRDNPRLAESPFDCAMTHSYDDPRCVMNYVDNDHSAFVAEISAAGGVWLDVTESICTESGCAPSRGGVVTYLDDNHLTASYARTLAGPVSREIHEHVGWWPADAYADEQHHRKPGDVGPPEP